jgi:hypothetical protein
MARSWSATADCSGCYRQAGHSGRYSSRVLGVGRDDRMESRRSRAPYRRPPRRFIVLESVTRRVEGPRREGTTPGGNESIRRPIRS